MKFRLLFILFSATSLNTDVLNPSNYPLPINMGPTNVFLHLAFLNFDVIFLGDESL